MPPTGKVTKMSGVTFQTRTALVKVQHNTRPQFLTLATDACQAVKLV